MDIIMIMKWEGPNSSVWGINVWRFEGTKRLESGFITSFSELVVQDVKIYTNIRSQLYSNHKNNVQLNARIWSPKAKVKATASSRAKLTTITVWRDV